MLGIRNPGGQGSLVRERWPGGFSEGNGGCSLDLDFRHSLDGRLDGLWYRSGSCGSHN